LNPRALIAFVYTFARYDPVNRGTPGEDFDVASAGLLRVLDDSPRADAIRYALGAQAAFTALAEYYLASR